MRHSYEVSCEIAGKNAMFTNPATGDAPVSYPIPTASAVRGIFECVNWGPAIEIVPHKVEICCPIRYENYLTNYGGPLRKTEQVKKGNSYQLLATILVDVCYKLYAYVYPMKQKDRLGEAAVAWDARTTSPGHAYKSIFERRLKRGQCFHTPSLGWKEFTPDYFGPLRPDTYRCDSINLILPSLLMDVFADGYATKPHYRFAQNVKIENGVMYYPMKGGDGNVE